MKEGNGMFDLLFVLVFIIHSTIIRSEDENFIPICHNAAVSIVVANSTTCSCRPGHTGRLCDVAIDECASNPCENGGICIDQHNSFRCSCSEGFIGRTCQHVSHNCSSVKYTGDYLPISDECKIMLSGENTLENDYITDVCEVNVPCHNGGVCLSKNDDYSCKCSGGFTGKNCEIDIDECMSSPCQNGGACQNEVDAFFCECYGSFNGTYCEKARYNSCGASPCQGNGTCTKDADGYHCICPPGITGRNCEGEIDECASCPCKNNGVCQDQLNGYNCTCQDGYTGINCEIDRSRHNDTSFPMAIFFTAIFLTAVCAGIFRAQYRYRLYIRRKFREAIEKFWVKKRSAIAI